MRVDVVMPQMGESIAEGTITRWIKSVGDTVERDEPIFEISTDKVDAEIPSPAAGTLVEIKNQEGETVPINEVVGVLETDADASVAAAAPAAEQPVVEKTDAPAPAPTPAPAPAPAAAQPAAGRARFVSPVVRRIADEHGIDPSGVPGSGAGGRVTKKDILAFIASGAATAAAAPVAAMPAPASPAPRGVRDAARDGHRVLRARAPGDLGRDAPPHPCAPPGRRWRPGRCEARASPRAPRPNAPTRRGEGPAVQVLVGDRVRRDQADR